MKISEVLKYEESFLANDRNGIKEYPKFSCVKGNVPIILTAPHTIKTKKIVGGNVVYKQSEPYTGAICKILNEELGCYTIYRNNYPSEYDNPSEYSKVISKFIEENKILYLMDIHGLSKKSPYEVALGINNGEYIYYDNSIIEIINECFSSHNISVDENTKYQASGSSTICRNVFNSLGIYASQFEINKKFRDPIHNISNMEALLSALSLYIIEIERYLNRTKKLMLKK